MKVARSADLPTKHASFFPILVILLDKTVLEYVYANNPSNVPDHKKRADIHLLQVQFAEYIQIWAVPNMLQAQRMVLTNPNPGIVSIQFSTCLKLTFITKTYRLQKSFSLYFSAFFPMT